MFTPSPAVILLAVWLPWHLQGEAVRQDTLPADLVRIQRLLDSNRIDEAIKLAEAYAARHRSDSRGYVAVGDAYAVRVPSGRFRAFQAYRHAERLDRANPEIPYRMAQLGLELGGADGERIAHDGLERVLELDPLYRDAWDQWLTLYRNSGTRRSMIERLAPFADDAHVKTRLALLYIEEEAHTEANRLLRAALAEDSTNAVWLGLLSQSLLEQGDTVRGLSTYNIALRHAYHDSTDVLWGQVVGIATPSEIRAWHAGVPPERKADWIRSFWARRNPDLFVGANRRIVEHFQRFRHARKHFPLLHPLLAYHRTILARTLNLDPSRSERAFHLRCEVYQGLGRTADLNVRSPGSSSLRARTRVFGGALAHLTDDEKASLARATRLALQRGAPLPPRIARALLEEGPLAFAPTIFAPLNLDLRGVDSVAARVGYNLVTGLSDRGIMYLRFGPPDQIVLGGDNMVDPTCNTTEIERWRYAEWGEVRFAKPTAFSEGLRTVPETVFRPMNEHQFQVMELGLTRDASSDPAPLEFGVWTAQFRGHWEPARTELVVAVTRGAVAATLVGDIGGDHGVQQRGSGVAVLTDRPGGYLLVAHARDGGVLGRQHLRVALRDFAAGPKMADLLVSRTWPDPAPTRSTMLDHLDPALVFAAGDTLRVYTELYGIGDVASARYRAVYSVLKTNDPIADIQRQEWPEAIRFEFLRQRRAERGTVRESMDLEPRWLDEGTYLIRVTTFDDIDKARIGTSEIAFEVRRP